MENKHAWLRQLFEEHVPFHRFLGISFAELGEGHAIVELPFRNDLIGNPALPALHGGVISALLDTCGGAAVWSKVGSDDTVSTVDIRVDYLRPARAATLFGTGRVVRLGNRVGVAELRAYHAAEEDKPVAIGTGVYNLRRGHGPDISAALGSQ